MKNKKTKLLAVSTLITSLAIGSVLVLTRHSIDTFETDADANYTIVLDKNNAYSSGTTKDIPTVSGHSTVKFSYSNASSESNAHVKLANSGVITNVEQITSIHNFKVDFTGSLQVRTSYDKETWGSYFDLIDEHNYQFDSHPYYFEIKATAQSVINSITVKYTCEANPAIPSGKPTESYYEKVTTASDLVSGQYLIVYDDSKAFDGSRSTLDAVNNYISVSVSNNKIAESNNTIAAEFTFDLTQGSIRSASGYYIGRDTYSNGLDTSTTFNSDFANTISADGGSCDVVAVGGCSLKFNKASDQNRFRFYKSGQQAITFFKKVAGVDPMPTPVDVVSISITDTGSYSTLTSFAASNHLVVKAHKSDDSEVTLTSSDYTAVLRDSEQNVINQNENFASDGTYTLTVTYNGFETSLDITVGTVAVQSISIPSETELSIGGTEQLNVTFTPSNASNKNVSWVSDTTSVATVSASGLVTAKAAGSAIITATSEDGGKTANCTVTVNKTVLDKWTIMIYMCGSDLESDNGFAVADLDEILGVSGQPSDVNIIVQTGGSTSWTKYGISNTNVERYYIRNGSLIKESTVGLNSTYGMGRSSTFQSFLEWGLNSYPAQKTGVILWDHGGAMDGVCLDHNDGDDLLTNSEANTAIKNAFKNTSRTQKLEWIGYDACLMQVQDIAEFNSQYFNYMIASQESEAGEGWAYRYWVDDLYANKSTETILNAICDGFIQDYEDNYGSQYDNDQTLSVLDLSYMSQYKSKLDEFTTALKNVSSFNVSSYRTMLKSVKNYGDSWVKSSDYSYYINTLNYPSSWFTYDSGYYLLHGYYMYGTFDIVDLLNKTYSNYNNSTLRTKINELNSILGNLIEHNAKGDEAGNSNGLCCVFAMGGESEDGYFVNLSYTASETNLTSWRNLALS